jgi:hypothetical protein
MPSRGCDKQETMLLIALARKNPELRYCKECALFLPSHMFPPKCFFCNEHFKQRNKRWRDAARAIQNIWVKSWTDKKIFDQPEIKLRRKDIQAIVTPAQLENFSLWNIVPTRPLEPLSASNATVVHTIHRRRLLKQWKWNHDVGEYTRILVNI